MHGVCAPADGRRAYVTVESTHEVKVVDTRTNTVIDTIALPGQPNECAVTSDGHLLAVPLLAPANSVVIYDLSTKALVKTLPIRKPHNCFVPGRRLQHRDLVRGARPVPHQPHRPCQDWTIPTSSMSAAIRVPSS